MVFVQARQSQADIKMLIDKECGNLLQVSLNQIEAAHPRRRVVERLDEESRSQNSRWHKLSLPPAIPYLSRVNRKRSPQTVLMKCKTFVKTLPESVWKNKSISGGKTK